ncbi:hypothetical protein EC973_008252 [Apophysomyces ossiformis]|uniref:Uncharacterized protein n=1 Tax=Apophysomyces ossiformis TaxID=679940 RepID=A0A8H7BV97_9FUNG|nr:hypothetical protein EC973_008252 [Apophysomyces ossiformis]
MDLVYTTVTIARGPPFLDEEGKKVVDITVASIFDYLYFDWMTPLIRLAYTKRKLDDDDLPRLPPIYRGQNIYKELSRHRNRSLLYRIVKANQSTLIVQFILSLAAAALYYAPAFFLNRLLVQIHEYERGTDTNDVLSRACVSQVRVKSMLDLEIYRKTLRRMNTYTVGKENERPSLVNDTAGRNKSDDAKDSSAGTILNLMSTDTTRISDFCRMWYTSVSAPIELAAGIWLLYQLLGFSCIVGLMVLVVTLPITHVTAKLFAKTNSRIMESRDKRVNMMNEVLQGIRQVKFFAWETNWEKRIAEIRNIELRHLRTGYMCEALFEWLWQGTPILVSIASFSAFVKLQGEELSAPIAFTAIAVFNELRFALNALPEVFIEALKALISVRRIETFLEEQEISQASPVEPNAPVHIGFSNATIGWKSTSIEGNDDNVNGESRFLLKDINLRFPIGELSLICGSTGSGKTLMLLSLLGETTVIFGQVFFPRAAVSDSIEAELAEPNTIAAEDWILDYKVAYVSQSAWLQNASIRDNILFGLPYIKDRYEATITACALEKDLATFEDGDETEIGERGITLSGGQKARVALARAVYSRAKTVLMDDVLSAVDGLLAHTAKHLFEKCFTGSLMRHRTRILVTHHVKLCIGGSAYVVHLSEGCVDIAGPPSELQNSESLASLIGNERTSENQLDDKDMVSQIAVHSHNGENTSIKTSPRVLVEEEERSTGGVTGKVYRTYLRMVGGFLFWSLMAFLVFGCRGLEIAESWWLKKWAQSYSHAHGKEPSASLLPASSPNADYFGLLHSVTQSFTGHDVDFYLKIYICITVANSVIGASRFAVLYLGILRASRTLHVKLLHRVFRAPLRFFDSVPMGRILNRFASDLDVVDGTIPNATMNFVSQSIIVLSSILIVSTILPIFLVPMVVVAVCCISYGVLFLAASVELKRLDSVTKSPLFSHFTETIAGIATIRAFGATQKFLQDMVKRIDINNRPFYYIWLANRWVRIRYAIMGAAVNMITASIILLNLDKLDVAQAGFCLSFVILYSDQISWAVKHYTHMELNFNAVERVLEFLEIEQEATAISEVRPPPEWPTEGSITVQNLEISYAPNLPAVLRGLSFSIKPREKIGVVGRTGSGKSTLALSFFRFLEASKGNIIVDNLDIKDLGTDDLRKKLTIIPQGTLRSNLDPFNQFEDEVIFTALRRVHLLGCTDEEDYQFLGNNASIFEDLESEVSEGGKNFSQGQRQLLCLARALLKRNRIVWMDEATASVDFLTDKAIQKTILAEFADCTVLCIAHRLHTVMEYDRIMVLDQGQLVEFAR